jgi:two-component system sensor histidine kinase YesM
MSEDIMARINAPEPKLLEGHLGLFNVATILKLHYGQAYGLHAESIAGVGTTVTLLIPAKREDEEHA